jgi:hypothetical protein
MRACYPYCPYYQALADAPAGAHALACARAAWMCGCGNKGNKGNKNITIYIIWRYTGPLLPPCHPYYQRARFLPGPGSSSRPKGTAADLISLCIAGPSCRTQVIPERHVRLLQERLYLFKRQNRRGSGSWDLAKGSGQLAVRDHGGVPGGINQQRFADDEGSMFADPLVVVTIPELMRQFRPVGLLLSIQTNAVFQRLRRVAHHQAVVGQSQSARLKPRCSISVGGAALNDPHDGCQPMVSLHRLPPAALHGHVDDNVASPQPRCKHSPAAQSRDRREFVAEIRLAANRPIDKWVDSMGAARGPTKRRPHQGAVGRKQAARRSGWCHDNHVTVRGARGKWS